MSESREATYRIARGETTQFWEMYDRRVLVAICPIDYWMNGFHYRIEPNMEDGRLVCDRLSIDRIGSDGESVGPPISTEAVRAANVSKLLGLTVESVIFDRTEDGWTGRHTWPSEDFAEHGPTDEALDQMAQQYAWLMVQGRKPSGEFLDRYGIPRPTTTKWIAAARKRGILVDEHRKLSRSDDA